MTQGIGGVVHIRRRRSLVRPLPNGIVTTGTVAESTVSWADTCTFAPEIRFRDRKETSTP
jgi:hypothetical protein